MSSAPGDVNDLAQTLERLFRKVEALGPEQLDQLENFVESLVTKVRRQAAFDELLAIAPAVEAAGMPPLTEEEIQAEVDAVRAERRSRRSKSGR